MNGKIEFVNINKTFTNGNGQTHAVFDRFNYTALPGINSLLGTTGCGKTTLLKIAAGLIKPESGTILIGGKDTTSERAGYIPQHHTLLPWKNLRENTALPLQIQKVKKAERLERADSVLKRVGLGKHINSFPHECSGGMKQRAMLARQLLYRSRFWLLDEPFSSLDLPTRKGLQQLIRELQQEHDLTIMMVTHDIDEAISVADHISLICGTSAQQAIRFDKSMDKAELHKKIEDMFFTQNGSAIKQTSSEHTCSQPAVEGMPR